MFLSSMYAAFGVVLASTAIFAQMSPQLGGSLKASDQFTSNNRILVSGKVLADDGAALPTEIVIERICGDRVSIEAYADARGEFQFTESVDSTGDLTAESIQSMGSDSRTLPLDWNECELRATAIGYTSSRFSFAGKVAGSAQINIGALFIHRSAPDRTSAGQVVTALDLAVPAKARKEFNKGEDSIRKSDWKSAEHSFQKSIAQDSQFAAAWAELARVQQKLGDSDGAIQSFQKALELDPRMLVAYVGLCDIAIQERQWKNLEDSTDRILAINSDAFPQFWFLNAVAKYNLGLVGPAETSVLRGMRLDTQHRFPKMEHLFGVILGVKRQYAQAADHLKNYLRLDPKAPDASAVAVQLSKFQQLAAATTDGK